jgi:hypothetical protein
MLCYFQKCLNKTHLFMKKTQIRCPVGKCRSKRVALVLNVSYDALVVNGEIYHGSEISREVSKCTCNNCGHEWIPRKHRPQFQ